MTYNLVCCLPTETMKLYRLTALFCCILFKASLGGYVPDGTFCSSQCPASSMPAAGGGRSLKNSVSDDFTGYADVWSQDDGGVFTSDIQVKRGQAWPRIMEGITSQVKTPGYRGMSVGNYLRKSDRKLQYYGWWQDRTIGPSPKYLSSNGRQNGAYIWLNKPEQFHDAQKLNPKWPFTVEVNVWNYFDRGSCGGRRCDSERFMPDYFDSNGRYQVYGHNVCFQSDCFYAYYIVLQSTHTDNMDLNVSRLLKHLQRLGGHTSRIDNSYRLLEISAAAEGHAPNANGKFGAQIISMARP